MKEKLTNNWGLKLISLIAAVLIWLVIMNTNDPVTTFTINGIPIEFLNEDSAITANDMVYEVIGAKTVSVKVTTRTVDRNKITKDDFKATVDLNDIYGVTGKVAIKVQQISDVALVRKWEQSVYSVEIATEKIIDKTFDIVLEIQGEIEDGYVYRQCTLSETTVTLRAPESQIAKVETVKAIVDVSKSLDDEQIPVKLSYYNTAGNKLNIGSLEISANRDSVNANVVVQKTSPVNIDVVVLNKDLVPEGYRYINYYVSQYAVSVIGSKQAIAGLDKIQIAVDAAGLTENVEYVFDLSEYLPENVTVAGGETKLTVRIEVEAEGTTELEVPTERVELENKNSDWIYTLQTEPIIVEIFGLISDWEEITVEDILLSIDVEDLEPGEYELELTIQAIEGLELTVKSPAKLIIEQMEESTEESTEEDSEENTEGSTEEDSDQVSGTLPDTESEEGTEENTEEETASGRKRR